MRGLISNDVRISPDERIVSPFLARLGTPRIGDDQLPGYYCEQQKMWVVDTERGVQPIINEQVLSQLVTKTSQRAESDDDAWPNRHSNLLQLMTKTDTVREVDDNFTASQLLELVTKTNAKQREADDEGFQPFEFSC